LCFHEDVLKRATETLHPMNLLTGARGASALFGFQAEDAPRSKEFFFSAPYAASLEGKLKRAM